MRKLICILAIFTACKEEEMECKCDLEVTINGNGSYFVTGVPTDCKGGYERPYNVPDDHFILGLTNCR